MQITLPEKYDGFIKPPWKRVNSFGDITFMKDDIAVIIKDYGYNDEVWIYELVQGKWELKVKFACKNRLDNEQKNLRKLIWDINNKTGGKND